MKTKKLMVLAVVLASTIIMAVPAQADPGPSSGDIDITSYIAGPPPATAPTITTPEPNTVFSRSRIDVKGGCIDGLIVRIFRDGTFAGSAMCQSDNTYALLIQLTVGKNDLVARQYDFLDQASPDSDTVTVFYNPPAEAPQLPGGGQSGDGGTPGDNVAKFGLIIDHDYKFTNVAVDVPFHLPIHFAGGTGPYAISVNWGDGRDSVVSRENTELFFVDHTYRKPGVYTIKLHVSDRDGAEAYIEFVIIVSGHVDVVGEPGSFTGPLTGNLLLYIIILLGIVIVCFFAGFFFGHGWKSKAAKQANNKTRDRQKRPPAAP